MSLVDYASSSEDEEEEIEEKGLQEDPKDHKPTTATTQSISSSNSASSTASVQQLPDASLLFSSPAFSSHQMSGSDHYSRVAAAMEESASRKRESNGLASSQRNKYPRSNKPHLKSIPDTVGGLLVPPQLSGRSNVVTEDLSKLFARKNPNPSLNRSSEQPS